MGASFFVRVLAAAISMARFAGDQRRQEDVSESVETDGVQVVVGEVEFESTSEVLDLPLKLASAQDGDGCGGLLKTSTRIHRCDPLERVVTIRSCTT